MIIHCHFPLIAAAPFLAATVALAENAPADLDTRGPVVNTGMTVQLDKEGVQAPGYIWQKPEAKTTWTAHWIGSTAQATPGSSANCVRKEINLDQEPKKVTAWISSGNYLLYVNGKPAARGPADAGHDFTGVSSRHHFYDVRDLTIDFHRGSNVLGAELLGCNDLLLELLVEYPDGKTLTIGTDETWKGNSAAYLKNQAVPAEDIARIGKGSHPLPLFDAQAEPVGWLETGFDDSQWPACKIGNAPNETMVVSELPPLMEARYPYFDISHVTGAVTVPDRPFQDGHPIIVQGDGEFAVHFNKIMAGRCGIKVKGSKGTRIYLAANEIPSWGGKIYQMVLRDGVQSFESRDYSALGTIYVVVRNATAPVEIMDVSADFLSQPVEYKGSFACSDDSLNTLWKSGRWSTQICMITHHLDSPQHQEPISDYGDYLIADLVNYYSMGSNPWLARQDLRKWAWVMENAKYRTFHTSYMFYWLQSLINYYDYTGDESMVAELTPNVHALIDQFTSYIGPNGIISEAPNYMFMDWVQVHDDQNPQIEFPCHHPPAVIGQGYMTALFYRALADAITVSKLQNDTAHAVKYEKLRQRIAAAYQSELWNPAKGMYRDGKPFVTSVKPGKWLPADVAMESFSVQNNALAVLNDLAPAPQRESIVENMIHNKNWDVTPFFMHFVFDSMAHANLFSKYGVEKMHEYRVIPETQTVREMGPERGDYSHGWIASPTYQMSSKILGVSPAAPGFDRILIRPELCGLVWAKGTVPTPHGPVDVAWQSDGTALRMNVTLPTGTGSFVEIPTTGAPGATKITDAHGDPVAAKFLAYQAGRAVYEIGPGSYQFHASE
jgi:hypothetical protein